MIENTLAEDAKTPMPPEQTVVSSPDQLPKPEKSEVDILSFLQVRKQNLIKKFDEKNKLHRDLLKQADQVRDEVQQLYGAGIELDKMIEEAKGVKS